MRPLTASLVQETTTTAGAGTMTLVAQTGWVQFSQAFANGALSDYSVRDGNNWEWGQGTVGAAKTLARTTIYGTLVAGVYTVGGAAMALAGTGAIVRAIVSAELFSKVLKLENVLQAGNFNAADGFSYGLTANNVIATLSAAPVFNDTILFYQGAAAITGCSINPNGALIEGVAGSMTIDIPSFSFFMTYTGAGYGWAINQ